MQRGANTSRTSPVHGDSSRLQNDWGEGDSLAEEQEIIDSEDLRGLEKRLLRKLGLSFFVFGLINNVLYVLILSAALDLVPPSTPKGIIAFCNITPSLIVKVAWPYIFKGKIRYERRIFGCCGLSVMGMLIIASFDTLYMRLLGICFASFSSGLGELTTLQLSTTYTPSSVGGHSIGYFASGTGAAGIVGAFLWWEVRSLGVRTGIGLSTILPFAFPITYYYLLPDPSLFLQFSPDDYTELTSSPVVSYAPIPAADFTDANGLERDIAPKSTISLTFDDKLRLVKPLLLQYTLPLFLVYLFEYTINQGIAPTLLYPVPDPTSHPFLSKIIKSVRDYYPLWQLVYQAFVFLSRSSISFGLPPLPKPLLPLPAVVQGIILLTLAVESAAGLFAPDNAAAVLFVFILVSIEGTCGGLAYVNIFYRINQEHPEVIDEQDAERIKQEREFRIGSVGFSDSFGILFASLLAMPTEIELCKAQVSRGKLFCKGL